MLTNYRPIPIIHRITEVKMVTNTETKPMIVANAEYASFWRRLGAFFIDTILLSIVSWGIVNILYFIGMWTWKGQTLGQMVFNIKVIKIDGRPVDLRVATLRFLGYLGCILTLGIGFLWIFFDKKKQGLHDKLAETYVIRV
jgi:uncharacterized RDD family membrane protein YckC